MSVALTRRTSIRFPSPVNEITREDAPCHGESKRLLDYWQRTMARSGRFIIGRDIPARPIASLLKNILINEPVRGGADMRVRLSGSWVRKRFDGRLDGLLLSEIFPPAEFEYNLADSNRVLATGIPSIFLSALKGYELDTLHSEVVALPILDRDGISPLLLVGIFYFE